MRKPNKGSEKKGVRSSSSPALTKELAELDSKIRVCTLCRLCESRTNAVPGAGRVESLKLMLVGEAPGRNEDLAGKPFVGAGGKLLDSLLHEAGIERSDIYITNIVKCRPPENRKPLYDEIDTCTKNYLASQVELLKPELICTLGTTALEYFTGDKVMGKARGRLIRTDKGTLVLPTYHPASVFRNRSFRTLLLQDLKKVKSVLEEIEKGGNRQPTAADLSEDNNTTLDRFSS